MGGLLDKLTKTGLADSGGKTKFYDSPDAALSAGNTALARAPRPEMTIAPPTGPVATPTTIPMPPGVAGPEESGPPSLQFSGGGPQMSTPPAANLPTIFKPSFTQASTDATGMPAASTPGLTRGGKLLEIMGLGLKGALAGQAASERAVAESGGHRSGGFGTGFEAGLTEPAREVAMKQNVEHGGLVNQMERAQIQAFPWLKQMQVQRQQAQINRDNATAAWRQWQMDQGGKATIEETIAAKQKIADAANLDPEDAKQFVYGIKPEKTAAQPHDEWSVYSSQHPGATIEDFWKARQKLHPGASETSNEFRNWMDQHPGAGVEDYWAARNSAPKSATRGQEAAATTRQKANFRKLEGQYKFVPDTGEYEDRKTGERISADEFTQKKNDVQDAFEAESSALSGNVIPHSEIPVTDAQGKTPKPASKPPSGSGAVPVPKKPAQSATPAKGARKTYQGHPYEFDGSKWVLAAAQ